MRLVKTIAFFFLLFFSVGLFAEASLEIKVETAKNQYILGEPCYIKVAIENKSEKAIPIYTGSIFQKPEIFKLKIDGPLMKECNFLPTLTGDICGCGKKIEAKEKIEQDIEIGILGLYFIGNYEIWLEYDPLTIPANIVKDCGLPKEKITSNHINITFIQPIGIDLSVYQKHHNQCNQITLLPTELLQKYPTSTYAGYALTKFPIELGSQAFSCLDDPYKFMHSWYDRGAGEDAIQKRIAEAKESMKKYLGYTKVFLEAHPDFCLNPTIRRKYIMCLGFTGQENEAKEQLRSLAKGVGKEAEEARAFLSTKSDEKEKLPTKEPSTGAMK